MAVAEVYRGCLERYVRGELALLTDTIRAALVTSAYTPDQDGDEFWSDVVAFAVATPSLVLVNPTLTYDAANDREVFDADPITFAPGATARYVVFYSDTGVAGSSVLLWWWDLGADLTGITLDPGVDGYQWFTTAALGAVYGRCLAALATAADLDSQPVRAALVTSAYVPDQDGDEFWSDVQAFADGASVVLANPTVITDPGSSGANVCVFSSDPVALSPVGTGRHVVFYRDTGVAGSSKLLWRRDLGMNVSSPFTLTPDPVLGWLRLETAEAVVSTSTVVLLSRLSLEVPIKQVESALLGRASVEVPIKQVEAALAARASLEVPIKQVESALASRLSLEVVITN